MLLLSMVFKERNSYLDLTAVYATQLLGNMHRFIKHTCKNTVCGKDENYYTNRNIYTSISEREKDVSHQSQNIYKNQFTILYDIYYSVLMSTVNYRHPQNYCPQLDNLDTPKRIIV